MILSRLTFIYNEINMIPRVNHVYLKREIKVEYLFLSDFNIIIGGKKYMSHIYFIRKGFSDIQSKYEEMFFDTDIWAVCWTIIETHNDKFYGLNQNY